MNKTLQKKEYTFNKNDYSISDLSKKAKTVFNEHGFCLIENVIPKQEISSIKDEIINSRIEINKNVNKYKEEYEKGVSDSELLSNQNLQLRLGKHKSRPPKPVNDIYWMKKFSTHLVDDYIVSLAKNILDEHLKISQLHPALLSKKDINKKVTVGKDVWGLPKIVTKNNDTREWHTDWPHDPWAYGGINENENIGCIKEPFPDITMCVVMIWYLSDVNKNSGGTWVVPGSHKFLNNPRGLNDNISPVAPIPGEMQVEGKAGSVFIQDSRLWHSVPVNQNDEKRVSVVNRWNPWWLSIDDYAPLSRFNIVCRPLSLDDFNELPKKLKPLMTHLCPDINDTIQKPLIDRTKLSVNSAIKKYQNLEKNPSKTKVKNKNFNFA